MGSVTYSTDRENEAVRYLLYLWVQKDGEDFNQAVRPLMIDVRQILNVRAIYWFPQKAT